MHSSRRRYINRSDLRLFFVHFNDFVDEIPPEILNITQSCPYFPIVGNQHKEGSQFCIVHKRLEARQSTPVVCPQSTEESPNIFIETHSMNDIGKLPNHDDKDSMNFDEFGCKKPENVNKFYSTTAGTMMAIRPCGVIVNFMETFKCESCTQVCRYHLNLLFTLQRLPCSFIRHFRIKLST